MRLVTIIFVIFMRFFNVENRVPRHNYIKNVETDQDPEPTPPYPVFNFAVSPDPEPTSGEDEYEQEPVSIKNTENEENREEYGFDYEHDAKQLLQKLKEPCAIVVLSNIQSPTMQSLIRRYKYDAQGVLIPSSVKYFMKVPQGYGPPVLVPLNDKSFSHLGGFVRYYKAVPPIPLAY